jgi:signal transduction histidine kinase/HPt (histidine-containing phosphotransfer) domain-containing protein
MINRLANATRLTTRVYAGYALVGLLALAMLAIAVIAMERIRGEFDAFSESSRRYRDGLVLAREIADMQRAAQAYTFEGHQSAATQVDVIRDRLRAALDAPAEGAPAEETAVYDEVRRHLATYSETFDEVRRQRDLQADLVEREIGAATRSLLARLGGGLAGEAGSRARGAVGGTVGNDVAGLMNELLQVETNAYRYFETLDAASYDEARRHLRAARAGLEARAEGVLPAFNAYERLVLEAVQRTRGYLYLVNVVMAAEAYEMLYQSRRLARLVSGSMQRNEDAIAMAVPRTIAALALIGVLLLAVIIGLSWVVGQSIAQPIRRMADTFRRLAAGAGDAAIPAYASGDELSDLGRAASVFREKNNETQSLLKRYQALSESLEAQVAERTAALETSNTELRNARDAAEAAARAKSDFLANMSHEIRTPVHALQGQLQLLENSGLTPEQEEYARQAWVSNKTLSMLLNDILDFSKIEAGKMELEAEPVNLTELLEELEVLFREQARTKGLDFRAELSPALPEWVRGDAMRLTQVLLNLLSNAIKFTSEGCITLRARSDEGESAPGQCALRFEVEDTGIGIPPEKLEAIFEEFTQAESSTTRTFGGTGLGLTIARRIVDLLGGRLEVRSRPDEGSCFAVSLVLPTLSAEEIMARYRSSEARLDLGSGATLAGLRVLLTEDNASLQKMTRLLLEQQGAQVTLASNGREALDALRGGLAVDVVLMDLQMPVMGGIDATRGIRQRWSRTELPVIAMTANATRGDRDDAAAVGMNDFLAKPLDFQHLVRALQRHTGRAGAAAPAAGVSAAASAGDPAGFELRAALARMAGQASIYREAAQPFLDGHRAMVARVRAAVQDGDPQGAARGAHELKGTASLLGATRLREEAGRAEAQFRAGADGEEARVLAGALEAAVGETIAALPAILDSLAQSEQQQPGATESRAGEERSDD